MKNAERKMEKDGGSIAPSMVNTVDGVVHPVGGLTVRDHFAAAALTGLCANVEWLRKARSQGDGRVFAAQAAYGLADAMLAERELKKEGGAV
jgi:hypothetical protein